MPVRVGSILVFAQGPRVRALRVEALPGRRGPALEAQASYSDLTVGSIGSAAPAKGLNEAENVSQQAPLD